MNIINTTSVLENAFPKGLQIFVVNIFDVFLKDGILFPPHSIAQLKSQLFLEFGAELRSCEHIFIRIHTVSLVPSPELLHGHIFPTR